MVNYKNNFFKLYIFVNLAMKINDRLIWKSSIFEQINYQILNVNLQVCQTILEPASSISKLY